MIELLSYTNLTKGYDKINFIDLLIFVNKYKNNNKLIKALLEYRNKLIKALLQTK